jgi:hypothetical protein
MHDTTRPETGPPQTPSQHMALGGCWVQPPTPGLANAIMSTHRPSLKQELAEYNSRLDTCLRSRYRMTLKTFKTLKALVQLVGAIAGIYAMSLGADPMTAFVITGAIIIGPESIEYLIEGQTPMQRTDDDQ